MADLGRRQQAGSNWQLADRLRAQKLELRGRKTEVGDQRSGVDGYKFKVQSLKLKLNLKGFYRLPIKTGKISTALTVSTICPFDELTD